MADAVKKPVYKKIWFWGLVIIVIGVISSSSGNKGSSSLGGTVVDSNGTTVKEYLTKSCTEYSKEFGLNSTYSDLQKDDRFNKMYKDKYVKWSGEVSEISDGGFTGLTAQVKCLPTSLTSDVLIHFPDTEKEKLMSYAKGATIKFEAKLDNWGTLLPSSLSNGLIIQ